jgi:hypothetical protein
VLLTGTELAAASAPERAQIGTAERVAHRSVSRRLS